MPTCYTSSEFVAIQGGYFPLWISTNSGTITWLSTGTAGDTITIGGVTLTAVTGARSPGSSTWSVDGAVAAEVASFVAAVNDSALSSLATAVVVTPGTSIVTLTSVATGVAGALPVLTSAPLVYQLSAAALSGWDTQLGWVLSTVCSMIGPCWGAKGSSAFVYLASHLLTVAQGGEAGVVTSRSIDRISTGYASTGFDTSDAALASTRWGRLYLALRQTVLIGPVVGRMGSPFGLGWIGGGGCGC